MDAYLEMLLEVHNDANQPEEEIETYTPNLPSADNDMPDYI